MTTSNAIQTETMRLATAPALAVWCGDQATAAERGVVLFFHGFTVDKQAQLPELTVLAQAGYLGIGLDAAGHGERRLPDFEQRFGGPDYRQHLFELVAETVAELPAVIDALARACLVKHGRLAIGGVSMGGHICYGAAVTEPRFAVVAPILGSPHWPRSDSPHLQRDRFYPTALLSQNGAQDDIVSPEGARTLHENLPNLYGDAAARLKYVEFAQSGHELLQEDWRAAMDNLTDWLGRHLQ